MTHVYDPATAINDPNGITWGMHPIAWRNDDIPEVGEWNTIDVMFDDLAEAGFAGTEVAGWYPSKEETKEKADAAGLRIVAQWFSSFIVRDGVEAVIPDFRATCEYLHRRVRADRLRAGHPRHLHLREQARPEGRGVAGPGRGPK